MKKPVHVLVAGCGWLGTAVARELARRGDRVTAVRRDPARAETLRSLPAEPLALDLSAPGSSELLPADLDAVIACQSADGEGAEAYRRSYVEVNRVLARAAASRGARLVYTGSTGVFGQRNGEDVDEATPPAPASPSAERLVEGEGVVREAGGCVVRLSGLYGPGRLGVVERVRSGAMALGPGDDAWTNGCHLEDAVAAVLAALDRGRAGALYHATDATPLRRREVVELVAGLLGITPPRAGGVAPSAAGARGANRRVLGESTRAQLSLELRHPSLRSGLEAAFARSPRPG